MWTAVGFLVVDAIFIVLFLLVLSYCASMVSWCLIWEWDGTPGCEFAWTPATT